MMKPFEGFVKIASKLKKALNYTPQSRIIFADMVMNLGTIKMKKAFSVFILSLVFSSTAQAGLWDDAKNAAAGAWEGTKSVVTGEGDDDADETKKDEPSLWDNIKQDASKAWDATKATGEGIVQDGEEAYDKGKNTSYDGLKEDAKNQGFMPEREDEDEAGIPVK